MLDHMPEGRLNLDNCQRSSRLGADLRQLSASAMGDYALPKCAEDCEQGGREAKVENWSVARSVFIADDEATAKRYATDPHGPFAFYYHSLSTKMRFGGRLNSSKEDQSMDDDDVTLDYVCDRLVTYGTVNSVTDKLLEFREQTGPFGKLV